MAGRVAGMPKDSVAPPPTKPVGRNQAADMSMYQQTRSPFVQQSEALAMDKSPRWTDVGQGKSAMSSAYDQDMFQNLSGMETISRNQEARYEDQYNRIQDSNFSRDSRASAQQARQNENLAATQGQWNAATAAAGTEGQRKAAEVQEKVGLAQIEAQKQAALLNQQESAASRLAGQQESAANRSTQRWLADSQRMDDTTNRDADRMMQRSLAGQADATTRRGQDLQFAAAQYGNDSAKYQAYLGASQGQRYWGNW